MQLLFWKKSQPQKTRARTSHTLCPVCKGQRTVRMTAGECGFERSAIPINAFRGSNFVMRPCWACQGTGQVAIESAEYKTRRFDG